MYVGQWWLLVPKRLPWPHKFSQRTTNNGIFTFNISNTIGQFTISVEQDKLNWWHEIQYTIHEHCDYKNVHMGRWWIWLATLNQISMVVGIYKYIVRRVLHHLLVLHA